MLEITHTNFFSSTRKSNMPTPDLTWQMNSNTFLYSVLTICFPFRWHNLLSITSFINTSHFRIEPPCRVNYFLGGPANSGLLYTFSLASRANCHFSAVSRSATSFADLGVERFGKVVRSVPRRSRKGSNLWLDTVCAQQFGSYSREVVGHIIETSIYCSRTAG